MRRRALRPLLPLVLAVAAGGALAQAAAPASAPKTDAPACPPAAGVAQRQLFGLWRAEFEGLAQGATLLLERHSQFAGSFAGTINRNGERRPVVGDIEDGDFTLEESADGVRIAATWIGDVVEGSCGREIRGTWQATGEKSARAFLLKKLDAR